MSTRHIGVATLGGAVGGLVPVEYLSYLTVPAAVYLALRIGRAAWPGATAVAAMAVLLVVMALVSFSLGPDYERVFEAVRSIRAWELWSDVIPVAIGALSGGVASSLVQRLAISRGRAGSAPVRGGCGASLLDTVVGAALGGAAVAVTGSSIIAVNLSSRGPEDPGIGLGLVEVLFWPVVGGMVVGGVVGWLRTHPSQGSPPLDG